MCPAQICFACWYIILCHLSHKPYVSTFCTKKQQKCSTIDFIITVMKRVEILKGFDPLLRNIPCSCKCEEAISPKNKYLKPTLGFFCKIILLLPYTCIQIMCFSGLILNIDSCWNDISMLIFKFTAFRRLSRFSNWFCEASITVRRGSVL